MCLLASRLFWYSHAAAAAAPGDDVIIESSCASAILRLSMVNYFTMLPTPVTFNTNKIHHRYRRGDDRWSSRFIRTFLWWISAWIWDSSGKYLPILLTIHLRSVFKVKAKDSWALWSKSAWFKYVTTNSEKIAIEILNASINLCRGEWPQNCNCLIKYVSFSYYCTLLCAFLNY